MTILELLLESKLPRKADHKFNQILILSLEVS